MTTRLTAVVKWFNDAKGYGFLVPDGQESAKGRDVFVHISAVERAGLDTLKEGQRVSFELEKGKGMLHFPYQWPGL